MLQVSVSRGVVHDALWWALAAVVIWHILNQPPAPPDRAAHQQPSKTPEGHEKVTPVAFARAAS